MAIAPQNRQFFTPSAADPTTQSYTVGDGATLLVVKVTVEATVGTERITQVRWGGAGGTIFTESVYRQYAGQERRQAGIWTLVNPTAQTADIWFDLNTSFALATEVVWFTGADPAAAIADADFGQAGTTASSVTTQAALVPSGTDNWLETCLYSSESADLLSPQGSATETVDQAAAGHRCAHSWQDNIDANVTPGWDKAGLANAELIIAAILIKPAVNPVYAQTKFRLYNDDGSGLGGSP